MNGLMLIISNYRNFLIFKKSAIDIRHIIVCVKYEYIFFTKNDV